MKNSIFCCVILYYSFQANSLSMGHLPKSDSSHRSIVVAVIDTGIDMQNPNLIEYLWRNPGEDGLDQFGRLRENNGIDDDRNGYIDDIHGWNFYDHDSNLQDQIGHGSHIAGIITGHAKFTKVNKKSNVQIMILKYFSTGKRKFDTQNSSNQALSYALKMGAQIVNYSGGGQVYDQTENNLFTQLDQKGVWSIVAAGNDSENLITKDYFPAKYRLPRMIVVGSMNQNFKRSQFSNFGTNIVDLFAVGEGVWSFGEKGQKMLMSGTSQATALVTRFAVQINEITLQKMKKVDLLSQLGVSFNLVRHLPIDSLKSKDSLFALKRQVIAGENVISSRPQARLNL